MCGSKLDHIFRKDQRIQEVALSFSKLSETTSPDSVTRWVNDTMKKAGIDTNKYVTHSCRAAASSFLLHQKQVPLRTVMQSCGWSCAGTFARHYEKDIIIEKDIVIGEQMLS